MSSRTVFKFPLKVSDDFADGMTHVGTWQEPPFMWHLYEDARFRLDIKV